MGSYLLLQSHPNKSNFTSLLSNKLLQEAVAKSSNFVMSPLSFRAMLSFIALGATQQTLKQLLQFLGLQDESKLDSLCKKISTLTLPVKGSNVAFGVFGGPSTQPPAVLLQFTNAVWLHEDFNFKSSFEGIVKATFNAESRMLNYGEEAAEIIREINSWAESVSEGLINQLLPRDLLTYKPALVYANALYFKGKWDRKFDSFKTQPKNFYLLNGRIVLVPFMTSDLNKVRLYGDFNSYKVLALPYQNGEDTRRFSMYIILPKTNDGLLNLVRHLNDNPGFLNQDFQLSEVELAEFWIPKFKFSFELEASNAMKELGLTQPFNLDNQDFKEMVVSHKGRSLYVSKMFHKAYIEVDEEGTEATCFSDNHTFSFGYAPPQHQSASFVADHPFIFMIREMTSKTVLLSGAVLNPLLAS
ncbi:Serpin-ZX like [Quillaja saponaria]|uniref:Serpin-ZX like n=1 Tax=Quillaja saponaria TaxID=32244 RepID=A0AAD7Q3N3_QUISA|nr:Serpin-ZX like [Quillaja saponaria]